MESGQRRDEDVADQLVLRVGEQAGRADRLDYLGRKYAVSMRERAQLEVGPLGQVHPPVAVRPGDVEHRQQRQRGGYRGVNNE